MLVLLVLCSSTWMLLCPQVNVAETETEDQAVRRYMRAVVQSGVLNKVGNSSQPDHHFVAQTSGIVEQQQQVHEQGSLACRYCLLSKQSDAKHRASVIKLPENGHLRGWPPVL
jgi:hypothetical protein